MRKIASGHHLIVSLGIKCARQDTEDDEEVPLTILSVELAFSTYVVGFDSLGEIKLFSCGLSDSVDSGKAVSGITVGSNA